MKHEQYLYKHENSPLTGNNCYPSFQLRIETTKAVGRRNKRVSPKILRRPSCENTSLGPFCLQESFAGSDRMIFSDLSVECRQSKYKQPVRLCPRRCLSLWMVGNHFGQNGVTGDSRGHLGQSLVPQIIPTTDFPQTALVTETAKTGPACGRSQQRLRPEGARIALPVDLELVGDRTRSAEARQPRSHTAVKNSETVRLPPLARPASWDDDTHPTGPCPMWLPLVDKAA